MPSASDIPTHVLQIVLAELHKLKSQSDRAIAQLRDEDLFVQLNPDQNSISVIMKHMSGNMLSRWMDFRTTDGEKDWRNRDDEFVERIVPRAQVLEHWERGWKCLFNAMNSIQQDELMRTITIRGEAMSLFQAINRQTAHYGYHVGQIVLLAKHIRGKDWQYLTIPRGQSEQFNEQMRQRCMKPS